MTQLVNDAESIITSPAIGYDQKVRRLAALAVSALPYPALSAACQEALEKRADDVVVRHVLRCSNCYSCAAACPFGTIIPEYIPLQTSVCDVCLGRLSPGEIPLCARSAPEGSIRYGDFAPDPAQEIHPWGENVLVQAGKWEKDKV